MSEDIATTEDGPEAGADETAEQGLSLREAAARLHRLSEADQGDQEHDAPSALPGDFEDDDGEENDDSDSDAPAPALQPERNVEESHTVKIDGAEQPVTLEELKAGYQRHADYTRKTQSLASERRELETERERYRQTLSALSTELALAGEGPPDQKLFESNPAEYMRRAESWRARQAVTQKLAAERSRMDALTNAASEREQAQKLAVEDQRLAAVIPGWSDAVRRETGKTEIAGYLAQTYGATPDELSTFSDHRLVLLAHKAMLYDTLMSQRPLAEKKVRGLPRMQTPGTARTKQEVDQAHVTRLRDRYRKTGSLRDAAKLLHHLGD